MIRPYASRRFLVRAGFAGFGLLAAPRAAGAAMTPPQPDKDVDKKPDEKDVGAVEDLMREHGVLRRVLCIYSESAPKLRGSGAVDPRPIQQAAQLFRDFGEDYHERKLEEAHIFPAVAKAGGAAAALVDVLKAQHERGREITGFILDIAGKGAIAQGQAEPLARAFDTFALMYHNHTAREDTVVFPAWKEALTQDQLDDMADRFEDIEREQFGHDGFEDAVKRIAGIEQALGLADLAQFTAPPPPKL
ncbi:MAG TPA: hemerythrin domain-containing protein [Stellaceae bacterium]|nr:hemerythrin domain-containing protein [Stellaceae bacterium]